MRILHVSEGFLPRAGGIEYQVNELARAQRAAGDEVTVATATPYGPPARRAPRSPALSAGRSPAPAGACPVPARGPYPACPVHRLVAPVPWRLPLHPHAAARLTRLLREVRPDVVHVHIGTVDPFGWAAIRAARRVRLPAVVTVHGGWDTAGRGLYHAVRRLARWDRPGLLLTTASQAAAAPVRRVTGSRVPVRVVPNGVDGAYWGRAGGCSRPVRPRSAGGACRRAAHGRRGGGHAAGRNGGVHVVAGGFGSHGRPLTTLRLLAAARRRLPYGLALRATVAGYGPARPVSRRYLRRHRMEGWVRLTGRTDRAAFRDLLASADMYVEPAARGPAGTAALEARTAGVPVVARAQGGAADFVTPGREGLLGRDLDELAVAIAALAADDELRNRIARHSRAAAPEACAWPAVVGGFERCYRLAGYLAPAGR